MRIGRFTCRMEKELLNKVKAIALEQGISVNKAISMLVAYGIKKYVDDKLKMKDNMNN